MNIKWYLNHWYVFSIIIGILIVVLAVYSQSKYSIALMTGNNAYSLFSLETVYRILFNPLWAISLWFFEKGTKLNSQRHETMLHKISALLNSPGSTTEKAIYDIIYENENYESILKKRYKDTEQLENKVNSLTDSELTI